MIWLLLLIFFIVACGIVLVPMLRYRNDDEDRSASVQNINVYKIQLQELDTDEKNDLLSKSDAVSARHEIERRLLNIVADDEKAPASAARTPLSRTALVTIVAVILLFSVGLYLKIGKPGMPDFPLKSRQNFMIQQAKKAPEFQKIAAKVLALKAHLNDNPKDIKSWRMLGEYQTELNHRPEAAKAFQRWYQLAPDDVDAAVIYAESLIILSSGRVSPAALLLLKDAQKKAPDNPGVRHYLALALYQSGQVRQALANWKALEADSWPGAPWLAPLRHWIRQAQTDLGLKLEPGSKTVAPALSAVQRKAIEKMSPEQQKNMIRKMVGRLADKVSKNPKNIAGWFRLAKAYMVLGQREDAIKSLKQALKYAPDNMKPRIKTLIKKRLEIFSKQE